MWGRGPCIITPYEKEVLAIKRAMEEYQLTETEVHNVQIAHYKNCHGHSYPVWNRGSLSEASNSKKARIAQERLEEKEKLERQLEEIHGGKEGLASFRAIEKAKAEKEAARNQMELLRENISRLMPGCTSPLPLESVYNKTMAKKVFKINDKDFLEHFGESQKGGKQSFHLEDLLKIAHDKHGKVKFEAKRQADKDKECEEMRYPLEQQLLALEANYPEFVVSKAELKLRQIEKLKILASSAQKEADEYVGKVRKLMDAVCSAEAEYLTLLSPLHPSQLHTSSAGADKSTKSDTVTTKKAQKVTATITPISSSSSSSSSSPPSNSSYCELMQTILGQKRSVQAI